MDYSSRTSKDPETGRYKNVDGNITYEEWVNSLSPEKKKALELAKLKNERKTSDKLQYAKYKKVLGSKNVPKTFDLWQEMKYNGDKSEYNSYKKIFSTATGHINGGLNSDTGKPYQIITVKRTELRGIPNTITQIEGKKGGIDRNYYGSDGWQEKQISNNGHGHAKEEAMGKHGEHAHDYSYGVNRKLTRTLRDLIDREKKENGDIL